MSWTLRRALGVGLSAWELTALATGRIPPLTAILRRHPLLGGAATAWVAVHLLTQVSS